MRSANNHYQRKEKKKVHHHKIGPENGLNNSPDLKRYIRHLPDDILIAVWKQNYYYYYHHHHFSFSFSSSSSSSSSFSFTSNPASFPSSHFPSPTPSSSNSLTASQWEDLQHKFISCSSKWRNNPPPFPFFASAVPSLTLFVSAIFFPFHHSFHFISVPSYHVHTAKYS